MSKPHRHHYVPQTYLSNFCIPEETFGNIFVYDKLNDRIFKSKIKDIAVERDFYRLPGKDDEYYWENFYSKKIESKYPIIINSITSACNLSINNAVILSEPIKEEISHMICTQLLRTKKARENQFRVGRNIANQKLEELKVSLNKYISKEQRIWLNEFRITDKLLKELELPILNDKDRLNKFGGCLLERNWIVFYNKKHTDIPFITSDNPVNFFNIISKSTSFEGNGIGLNSTIIFFPLTKKILIALYPKEILFGYLGKFDGRMVVVDEENFINYVNEIQRSQAYRQVYNSKEQCLTNPTNTTDLYYNNL